jgi:23S rRNA (guanosine2251-2'-O)-methyltransferase
LLRARTRRVHEVWIASDDDDIARLASEARARVRRVPHDQLERRARTSAPQGVIAFAEPVTVADVDALFGDPAAFLVALDGVTDPQNVGAVMRTAEANGATGMVLPRNRAVALTPTVAKAAAGAIEHLPVAFVPGIAGALERAGRAHVWCVALDAQADVSVFDLAVADQPLVIVLGAEGRGLSRLARARCDVVASIPMHGHIESLNVSATAAIACAEVARRRSERERGGYPAE